MWLFNMFLCLRLSKIGNWETTKHTQSELNYQIGTATVMIQTIADEVTIP